MDERIDGEILKKVIQSSKYGTITNFASESNISRRTLTRWLRNGVIPSNKLIKILNLLCITNINEVIKKES